MTALIFTLLWGGAAICGALAFLDHAKHAEPRWDTMLWLLTFATLSAYVSASFAEGLLP